MGFFASGTGGGKKDGLPSLELMHRLQCNICPLDKIKNRNPHIPAKGAKAPLIYILGEAPGATEDAEAGHFIGKSGELLRTRLPKEVLPYLRWNNVVRTRPKGHDNKDRTPEKIEVECCRPSVAEDIAASQPRAIFGFGNIALNWATGQNGIQKWRGRKTPVEINGHPAWFYPMLHPAALLRMGRRARYDLRPDEIGSEEERAFCFDLQRALDEVENLTEPKVWTKAELNQGVELLTRLDEIESALNWAAMQGTLGLDYETLGLRPYGADAQIISGAIGTERRSFGFAFDHPGQKWSKQQRARLDELWRYFLLSEARKAAHNAPFEEEWSAVFYGADVLRGAHWECTYQQAACLDDRIGSSESGDDRYRRGGGSLDFLFRQYFGMDLKALSPLNKKDLRQEPLQEVLRYNTWDAKAHFLLWREQDRQLSEQGFQNIYRENLRRIPTLVLTQMVGVPVDQKENARLMQKYQARIKEAESEIADFPAVEIFEKRYKKPYRPSSNADTLKLLRDVMEFREPEQENGAYSVDEEALAKIDHPIVPALLKHRKASKLLSTYIIPYSDKTEGSVVWPDGLLHPNINPFGTHTNRTSADDPNIQNMPKRHAEAKEVRRQIVPPPGYLAVAIDYGQIQARGIAMMSKDKAFVKALWERYDVHTEWAERLAHAYPDRVGGKKNFTDKKVMKAFRTDVKNQWTFPLFFGAQLRSVADYLHIPADSVEGEYDLFWKTFSGVKDWQDDLLAAYQKTGVVKHLDGRLNRAPLSQNQIFNYPIQGLEAQIVLNAMNRLSEREILEFQAPLEIHDDLTFWFPVSEPLLMAREYAKDGDKEEAAKWAMDDPYLHSAVTEMLAVDFDFINVPLTVEASVGENLLEVQEILVASSDTWLI